MVEVSIRDLKSHLSEHLRRVGRGDSITITRRGKPVGMIVPSGPPDDGATRKMRELRARGVIQWSGEKPLIPAERVKLIGDGPTMSEMVLEDRG